MLQHYTEFMFMFLGIELIAKTWISPWASIVCGSFMVVLHNREVSWIDDFVRLRERSCHPMTGSVAKEIHKYLNHFIT